MPRERMMIAMIRPHVPGAPVHATWGTASPAFVPVLSGGNLVTTGPTAYTGPGTAEGRGSTVQLYAGQWYWETTHARSGDLTLAVGIIGVDSADPAGPFSGRPHVGTTGPAPYDLSPMGVGVFTDGTTHGGNGASVPTIAAGTVVRHWLDADARIYRVAVGAGSWVEIARGENPNTDGWPKRLVGIDPEFWPGVSPAHSYRIADFFGSGSGSVTANFGQNPFVYAPPPGVNPGVYSIPEPTETTVYLSSHAFGTGDKDEPSDTMFLPRIKRDRDTERGSSAACWVWGKRSASKRGSLYLSNADSALDHWAGWQWRDAVCEIYRGHVGDTIDQMKLFTRCLIDRDIPGKVYELVLADPLVMYDRPIQRERFPDDHPITTEAGNPIPLVLGLPFHVSGARLSPLTAGTEAFAWQIHDGEAPLLASIGTIFDNGINRTSDCVQWPAAGNRKGFRITGQAPIGKVTCNASGVSTTTVLSLIQAAINRLDDTPLTLTLEQQDGGVAGIGSWAALYVREPMTVLDVINRAMDSVGGWACPSRDGTKLRLGRIREPRGRTPDIVLGPHNILTRDLKPHMDLARNLTTRLGGRRNWSPHSYDEIAASIKDPLSGTYDPDYVERLMATWMAIRTGTPAVADGTPVSAAYRQADGAAVHGTLLQEPVHVQQEANRICTTWYPTRHLLPVPVSLSTEEADSIDIGMVAQLNWPQWGLSSGMEWEIVDVLDRFWANRVDFILFGSLPPSYE